MAIVFVGAGCGAPTASLDTTSSDSFAGLSPEATAERLQFLPGDTFQVKQTWLGLGASFPAWMQTKDGVRTVTIERFAPSNIGAFRWSAMAEQETASSTQRREAYEKQLKSRENLTDLLKSPPQVEVEQVTTSGTIMNLGLGKSHTIGLPAYWPINKQVDALSDNSGLWLSDDAYLELSKTNQTILNLGVFDASANTLLKTAVDFKAAMDALKNQVAQQEKMQDLTLVKAETERIIVPLKVNGREVKVSAIKGKNWFGEFIVLNSRQNPLILKLTINPVTAGTAQAVTGNTDINKVLGYEINDLVIGGVK